jgi:hypothetical protein
MKHLELFKDGFDDTLIEKIQPENWPYIGYDMVTGEIVCTVIPENNQIEYQMIDLGLPSGIKWADKNVGAETPQDNGLYFSWGNVDGHAVDENGNTTDGYSFDGSTYYDTPGGQYTGSTLDAEHDAATVNMDSNWRMPTVDEITELIQNTDHYYIDLMGNMVPESQLDYSSKLRSICFVKQSEEFNYNNRSNFIEIPFAGYCNNSVLANDGWCGCVWSNSPTNYTSMMAIFFGFNSDGSFITIRPDYGINSSFGLSVRGVYGIRKPEININPEIPEIPEIPIDPENPIGPEIPEDNQIERV